MKTADRQDVLDAATGIAGDAGVVNPRVRARQRRGAALLITLIAIAMLAVLSTGALLGSMQEYRAGRNSLVEQRALAVAEYGLNQQLSNWSAARNAMSVGQIDSLRVGIASGDTARVSLLRLTSDLFSVTAVGRASVGSGTLEAQRETNLIVRIAYPSIPAGAAITSYGPLEIKGSSEVTGVNTTPPLWTDCAKFGTRDTFAVAYNPAYVPDIQKAQQQVNGKYADPKLGDPNNFVVFGDETFTSLAAKANVIANGSSPFPSGTSSTCNYSNSNWGEPDRLPGAVLGCKDYFPIIYSPGDLSINGGRGQGILLVNGNLKVNGGFQFYGIIVVMNDIDKANGGFELYGTLLLRDSNSSDESTINGNASFKYSRCSVANAMRGSSSPVRAKLRSWAPVF